MHKTYARHALNDFLCKQSNREDFFFIWEMLLRLQGGSLSKILKSVNRSK